MPCNRLAVASEAVWQLAGQVLRLTPPLPHKRAPQRGRGRPNTLREPGLESGFFNFQKKKEKVCYHPLRPNYCKPRYGLSESCTLISDTRGRLSQELGTPTRDTVTGCEAGSLPPENGDR